MNAWILALAAAFFYGTALVLTQFGLRHRTALVGASLSVPTAAVFFVCLSPFLIDFTGFNWTALTVFMGVGLLFPGTVTLLTFAGNVRMGPNVTGAVGNLAPLFAVILAVTVLGEPFGMSQALGILVILTGVTLLTFSRGGGAASWPLWALLFPVGGAVVRGIIQPGVKWGLTYWPDPFAAVTTGYIVSAVVILVVVYFRKKPFTSQTNEYQRGYRWFVAVGLCNGVAVLLTYAALNVGDVSLVSPLIASYPLVTLILSTVVVRSAQWNVKITLGIVVTVIGVGVILSDL